MHTHFKMSSLSASSVVNLLADCHSHAWAYCCQSSFFTAQHAHHHLCAPGLSGHRQGTLFSESTRICGTLFCWLLALSFFSSSFFGGRNKGDDGFSILTVVSVPFPVVLDVSVLFIQLIDWIFPMKTDVHTWVCVCRFFVSSTPFNLGTKAPLFPPFSFPKLC